MSCSHRSAKLATALIIACCGACADTDGTRNAHPKAQIAPAAARQESTVDAGLTEASRVTQNELPPGLVDAIGATAADVVRSHDHAMWADLNVVAAAEAQSAAALADQSRVGGYPLRRNLAPLSKDASARVASTFLNRSSYASGLRRRCGIGHIVGFRFIRAESVVDVALLLPCATAVWLARQPGKGQSTWAEALDEAAAQLITSAASDR